MDKTLKVAFIGTGNMGGALVRAAVRVLGPDRIWITDGLPEKAAAMAEELGTRQAEDNRAAVMAADYIFLCVKPQVMPAVIREIAPVLEQCMEEGSEKVLVSIAAGLTTETLKGLLGEIGAAQKLVRVMPNTPAAIGKGMLAVCADPAQDPVYVQTVKEILSGAGRVEELREGLINAFTVVSGCAPAFVYMFIEALADGGVMEGLPRADAMTYAAQTLIGAASMVLETGKHPGQLKDEVCSPAGSTIVGVEKLEEKGFRSAVIEAVRAAYDKSAALGKN